MSLHSVQWSDLWEGNPQGQQLLLPCDVRFKVDDQENPSDQKIISAHKLLLAAVSPVFKDQFYGEEIFEEAREEGDGVMEVLVTDSQPAAFSKLMEFIYLGPHQAEVAPTVNFADIKTVRLVFDVMILADKYMINELKDICEHRLLNSILTTEENVFSLVLLVENTHFDKVRRGIKNKCKEFIKSSISMHGFDFLQKLNSQPSFHQETFRDLCSSGGEGSTLNLSSSRLNESACEEDQNTSLLEQGTKMVTNCVMS